MAFFNKRLLGNIFTFFLIFFLVLSSSGLSIFIQYSFAHILEGLSPGMFVPFSADAFLIQLNGSNFGLMLAANLTWQLYSYFGLNIRDMSVFKMNTFGKLFLIVTVLYTIPLEIDTTLKMYDTVLFGYWLPSAHQFALCIRVRVIVYIGLYIALCVFSLFGNVGILKRVMIFYLLNFILFISSVNLCLLNRMMLVVDRELITPESANYIFGRWGSILPTSHCCDDELHHDVVQKQFSDHRTRYHFGEGIIYNPTVSDSQKEASNFKDVIVIKDSPMVTPVPGSECDAAYKTLQKTTERLVHSAGKEHRGSITDVAHGSDVYRTAKNVAVFNRTSSIIGEFNRDLKVYCQSCGLIQKKLILAMNPETVQTGKGPSSVGGSAEKA